MMEKDKLRRADLFSGSVICLAGLWIISQALKMPMKDSWGGVQNVWYVSPAIFPLFVGAMIALLGALLIRMSLKTIGMAGVRAVFAWLTSSELIRYLVSAPVNRFYATVSVFIGFVFVDIARIDFFLAAVLFLTAFITMVYLDDPVLLKKLLACYWAGTAMTGLLFVSGCFANLEDQLAFPADWFTLGFIAVYAGYAWMLTRSTPTLHRKYKIAMIVAVVTPFVIGPIFKYFLLVPMPTEGLVATLMDAIRYGEF